MTYRHTARLGAVLAIIAATGCSSLPPTALATRGDAAEEHACVTNADYAMTGVVHAATRMQWQACRRGLMTRTSEVRAAAPASR